MRRFAHRAETVSYTHLDVYKRQIHAYPNAAAEVVALYFCENDYDKLVSLIAMCGLDVDCNAAQVANRCV